MTRLVGSEMCIRDSTYGVEIFLVIILYQIVKYFIF
jgi:hypothetical protein